MAKLFRITFYIVNRPNVHPQSYLRQRASWNPLLFITNPRLAIGRVVSHDDVPFADWCCTMEVKAEFLLSAACRNVDSAFYFLIQLILQLLAVHGC